MADKKSPVCVNIMGVEYRLKGTEEDDYLKKVAGGVEDRMKQISAKNPVVSSDRIAVLSAMQIFDELLKDRETNEKEEIEIRAKIEELAELVRVALTKKSP